MSSPIYQSGSIFKQNNTSSSPHLKDMPSHQVIKRGIFGQASSVSSNQDKSMQGKGRSFKEQPPKPKDHQPRGSLFRGRSRGFRSRGRDQQSLESHLPVSQNIRGKEFKQFNKNDTFPNTKSNQMMQQIQMVAAQQFPSRQEGTRRLSKSPDKKARAKRQFMQPQMDPQQEV